MKPRISVVINTLNEERNLPFALRSVHTWADEIVVVDMHSDDRTVEIARKYGAKIYFYERMGFCEPARQFAVENATGDWIFLIDADEVVSQSLSIRLKEIASENTTDVVLVPRLNYLVGKPIWHSGWGPDIEQHPRFFRKEMIELNPRIHSGIRPSPSARVLSLKWEHHEFLHHFCYLDWIHLIEKINRYTTVEAQQAFERREHASRMKAVLYATYEFANRFIRQKGYRDGWRGFYLAMLMMTYRVAIQAKLKELEITGGREKLQFIYQSEAESLIGEYREDGSLGVDPTVAS